MKFDINKVELKDLDGNLIRGNLGKPLGNYIYAHVSTLEWLAFAQAVHSGVETDATSEELKELKQIVASSNLTLMAKHPLLAYIDRLLKTDANDQ